MAKIFPNMVARGAALARRALALPAVAAVTRSLVRFGAPAISLAVLGGALIELRALDWRAVLELVPHNPAFWLVFVIAYSTPVLCDWAIYHRLWNVPVSGIAVFARKTIGNELLMGYVGEAYLFAWARREGHAGRAAFGAVKDVSILSAVVGNSATILVALAAAPFIGALNIGIPLWAAAFSLCVMLAPPIVAVTLRGRLFSLPRVDLRAIGLIHAVRATLTIGLTALLWHLALPDIAILWWLIFSAMKLLVSRLPLVSNKELVFAGMAVALLGQHADVPALMTMMATLMVAMHVVVGSVLGIFGLAESALREMRSVAGEQTVSA